MKCKLVFDDWRRRGDESIYTTPLGIGLSMGDLHSGTVIEADVVLPPGMEEEIVAAFSEHGSYPVFRLMPDTHNPSAEAYQEYQLHTDRVRFCAGKPSYQDQGTVSEQSVNTGPADGHDGLSHA